MPDPVKDYLKRVEKELQSGNTTEHSHRPHLKSLIQSFDKTILAINEPKRVKCGAPDYIVVKGQTPLGYIEAKDVGIPLSHEEKSEQMTRYRSSLSNLILTNYLDFRWYVSGEHRITARIGETGTNRIKADADGIKKFLDMIDRFLSAQVPTIAIPKELARRMAAAARMLREIIANILSEEEESGSFHSQLGALRKLLLPSLDSQQFADMYAQTICYGLFAARCNAKPGARFSREDAPYQLPKTNPFLRSTFAQIAGADLDERIVWMVDDLAELLNHADMVTILQDFGRHTSRQDPVVHFYETFLASYDPTERELRGVYYTPPPVVSYIVKSVDHILKDYFKLKGGLADATSVQIEDSVGKGKTDIHRVQILDPAAGTGTFLCAIVDLIYDSFAGNLGMWSPYVSQHLLPRLSGFELQMAPYAVAHMKLALRLQETKYDFKGEERLHLYLTNTLEEPHDLSSEYSFPAALIKEARAANKVKEKIPVMVVIGNPPYSGHSANQGPWIRDLLRGKNPESPADYFSVDGQPLGEKNPKWLNDDYVKFIRFAQWRIEKTGAGILAFVTNHSYLDNPTFRGMRQALMKTFTKLFLLDLHGSSKKSERSPHGEANGNVFDIQQGVAIGLFVKEVDSDAPAEVYHTEMWGSSEAKYDRLAAEDVSSTEWEPLQPQPPLFLFVPIKSDLKSEYDAGWILTQIFPVNVLGFQSHRDDFAVAFDKDELLRRIKDFRNPQIPDDALMRKYGLQDTREWRVHDVRQDIQLDKDWQVPLTQCLYRPLDSRYCYLSDAVMDRPRPDILHNVLGRENLCLNAVRQTKMGSWQHAVVSNLPSPAVFVEMKDGSNVFPLYLYPVGSSKYPRSDAIQKLQKMAKDLGKVPAKDIEAERDRIKELVKKLYREEYYSRFPNLDADFIAEIEEKIQGLSFVPDGRGDLKNSFGPENIFDYIYAVLNAPSYQERYLSLLKTDFPRVPLTSNRQLFGSLCALGQELVAVHLLEKDGPRMTQYDVQGDHLVERVRYTEPGQGDGEGRVWINKTQYFRGVPPEVWEFQVGGYQVCERWLKDRKGRKLSFDDLEHYHKIVSVVSETIRLIAEIDAVIEDQGGFPLE